MMVAGCYRFQLLVNEVPSESMRYYVALGDIVPVSDCFR